MDCIFQKTVCIICLVPFFICCERAGTDDADEMSAPLIIPVPQPELPPEEDDTVDEQEILKHLDDDFSWWSDIPQQERLGSAENELQFERGTMTVKLHSDKDYIYGYVEIDTTKVLSRYGVWSPEYLNNLGVWIDADDVHSGQGGGWFFSSSSKPYDILLRGRISENAVPLQESWNPRVNDVTASGDSFGVSDPDRENWNNVGTGKAKIVDETIFCCSFVIDRKRLGLENFTDIRIGISFDSGGYNDYAVIPYRTGFELSLIN